MIRSMYLHIAHSFRYAHAYCVMSARHLVDAMYDTISHDIIFMINNFGFPWRLIVYSYLLWNKCLSTLSQVEYMRYNLEMFVQIEALKKKTNENNLVFIWTSYKYASSWEFGSEQRRLRQDCASAQSRQSLHYSHAQSRDVDEGSSQIIRHLDPLDSYACMFKEWFYAYAKSNIISCAGS